MKKTLSIVASLLLAATMSAQVTQSYDATVSEGTFTEISGGTEVSLGDLSGDGINTVVIDGSGTAHSEDFTAEGYSIGFDFKFNNQTMNQFVVAPRGYIVLGNGSVTAKKVDPYFVFSGSDENVLGIDYRRDVCRTESTVVSYKSTSSELIVEFKNMRLYGGSSWSPNDVGVVSFQIHLLSDGTIKYVFKDFKPLDGVSLSAFQDAFKCGIRGTGKDRLTKVSPFTSEEFSTEENIIFWSDANPSDGLTYTFTPPEDCEAPASQPTSLSLESTSTSVTGTFTATDAADHYLVLMSTSSSLDAQPENGKTYAAGDSIGSARVLAYTTEASLTTGDVLDGASTYYFYVFATNSFCFYGPKYNTTSPLTGSKSTACAAPASIEVADADTTSITLSASANSSNDNIIVAYATEPFVNAYNQILEYGIFGTPSTSARVGSSIDGGGTVCYVGRASGLSTISGLEKNKFYFFRAWSTDGSSVSSTYVETVGHTAATERWQVDFTNNSPYTTPFGWNAEGTWLPSDNAVKGTIKTTDVTAGSISWIETPYIYLDGEKNRVMFSMAASVRAGWMGSNPFSFADEDVIEVQVTTDGENYTTLKSYTADSPLEFDADNDYYADEENIIFTDPAGTKARIRFYFNLHSSPTIYINDLTVERVGDCDYPANVKAIDSTIVADKATITWTPQGEEDAWELSYKKTEEEEWSEPVVVRATTYELSGLTGLTSYDVRVRARCSVSSKSDWSKTGTFTSGLAVPFKFAFGAQASLPSTWLVKEGELSTPTTLTDGTNWQFRSARRGNYLQFGGFGGNRSWFITPKINLGDGSVNYQAEFTITNTTYKFDSSSDITLKLVVAKDGETFNEDDVLYTVSASDMPAYNESATFIAPLNGITDEIRLGFYVENNASGNISFQLDTLAVQYTCKNDVDEITVDSLSDRLVTLSWTSAADEWYVFIREDGDSTKNYQVTTEPTYTFTGLTEHTSYEIGITKVCEPGDTAAVKYYNIATEGNPCAQVENVMIAPSKYSCTIEWQGEGSGYNIRYRKEGDENWETELVTDTTITLTGLENDATYEYQIQTKCSKAENDTSSYTPISTFTTLLETCFVPDSIEVVPSYNSAAVKWVGDVEQYEINCKVVKGTWEITQQNDSIVTGLEPNMEYTIRMRTICAEGDTSQWSSTIAFTTEEEPECVTPSNLTASNITESSVTLSWEADESNLTWNIRYRASSDTTWTYVEKVDTTSYELTGLEASTVYMWRVMANCVDDYTSDWASQKRFTTSEVVVSIDAVSIEDLQVFAKGRMLNIVNPIGGLVKSVQIYSNDGRQLGDYEVESTDNVFINLPFDGNVIVKVNGVKNSKTVKLLVK